MALKTIPTFLPNKSIVLNKPEEFLKNNYASDKSRNMEFYNEELRGRLGLDKFDPSILSGPVLLTEQFWKYDGTWSFMICTTKDIYKYDFNSLSFEILTPLLVATGVNTITIGTGASAFIAIGTGVNFTTEGIKAGDFIKIGTETANEKDEWFPIKTKDSETQLTIDSDGIVNELSNGSFENWVSGPGTAPDGWIASSVGAAGTIAKETSIVKLGKNSFKFTRNGADISLYQNVHARRGIAYWRGKTVTLGCWVYSASANGAFLQIYDGINVARSARHSGNSAWQFLTVSLTINGAADQLGAYLSVSDTEVVGAEDSTGYFDGATLVEGLSVSAYSKGLITPGIAYHYTIRKCFTGQATDQWHARPFQDAILGETWIATNGVDTPILYLGSGQVRKVTGLPTGFVTCKYLEVFKDRVIFLNTIESGPQPQRERWSGVANCEDYDDLDFLDHIEGGYWITGSLVWNGYHIIFRERDARVGRWVGGTAIFNYEGNSSCSGVWAPNSLCSTASKIYYYGPDNKLHSWNLITEDDISEPISPYAINFDPNLEMQIFGYQVEAKGQIRWFIPYGNPAYMNACIVWDYVNENLYIWEYQSAQACCSIGEYLNSTDIYIDDAVWGEYYIDEQDGFWDDRTFLDGSPQIIYGGSDGILRKADIGYIDDGSAYNRVFESTRNNFGLPNMNKRLWKQQHWLLSDLAGAVTISLKTDDKNTYRADTKSISLIDSTRDVIKKNITWDKHAENFKTRIESTSHFSMLGFLNYVFPKGVTNR